MVKKYLILIVVCLFGLLIAVMGAAISHYVDSNQIPHHHAILSNLFASTVILMTSLVMFYLYQLIQYKDKLQVEMQKQTQTAIALTQAQQQLQKINVLLESEIASQTEELSVQAEVLAQKNQLLEQEIEQRVQVEQTLRRSEKRFHMILDHLPAYVFLQDEHYQLHYANQYFYKIFNLQADEVKTCKNIIPSDSFLCEHCPAINVLYDGQPQRWECSAKNGHTYSVQAYPYVDIDGTELVLELGVDITDMKQTQQDLKISQERFNLALQGTSGGVWDWDLESNTAYFSKRWKAMLGYTANEISNDVQEWHKRIHPQDKSFVLELIQYYLTKNYSTYENTYRLQHKQGHYIWVLDRGFALWDKDTEPNRFTGMHVDISQQKITEQVLRQKEEFLRSLLDSVPQYICWKNADSIFQGCNQSFAQLVGLKTPKDILGKTDFDLIDAEKAEWFRKVDAQIIAENKPRYSIEEIVHFEDKTLWFETSKVPLHDENGQVSGLLIAINDVSERKQAEELLKKYNDRLEQKVTERTQELAHKNELLQVAQHRFTTVLDSLTSAVYVADMQTFEILFVNRKAQEFFGDDLVGNTCWKVFYDDQEGACEFCSNARLVDGDVPSGLLTCEHYNEKVDRWFFLQEQAIYWDNGKVVRLSVASDITERKEAEAMLLESQARLLETQRIAHIGHWEWDLQSQEVLCSEEVARQFGYLYEAQYVPVEAFSQAIHPEDQAQVHSKIKQALSNKAYYTAEFRVQSGGHHLAYLQTIAEVVTDSNGEPTHILGSSQDITERKQAEIKLKRTYEELTQFKNMLDKTLDSILMNDVDTMRFTYANEGATKLLGYSEQELLQFTPVDISNEFTYKKLQKMLEPLIEQEIPALKFETSIKAKDRRIIPVEVFIQYFEVSKQDKRFIAVVRDITERKQVEYQLQQAIRTAREAQTESERANQAKTMFLANMSHELRTPLNGILGYAQLLERDKDLSEKQLQSLSIIQRSGEHLLTLINDILDLSKIEAGKLELQPSDFRLSEFLLDIVDLFSIRAKQKGIDFTYEQLSQDSQSFPIEVFLDEKRLRQILLNLLSNAIKFTDKGSVSLKYIYFNKRLRFEIQDTGVGIGQQHLSSIFEPFRQIDNLHTKTQEGTGLGLPITQRLVYMMNGELHVETELNKGSLFWFEIPLLKARYVDSRPMTLTQDAQHVVGYRLTHTTAQHKLKILIADDIKENGLLLESLLEPLGFELYQAYNGQQAINKAIDINPDIIIMDMKMPVMDGLETTRALRQLAQFKDTVIIGFSASVLEKQQKEMLAAGCNAFLSKPIINTALFDCLSQNCQLEWIYDNYQIESYVEEPKQVVLPPSHELEILLKLSVSGKIQAIQTRLESLQKRYGEAQAFINEIQTLLDSFELKKLKEVLKHYLY